MNGPNQLGAVSDPPEKRAARALSKETRKMVAGFGGVGPATRSGGCVSERRERASIVRGGAQSAGAAGESARNMRCR